MDTIQQLTLVNQLNETNLTPAVLSTPEFVEKYEYLVSLTKYLEDMKKNVDSEIKSLLKSQYYETGDNSVISGNLKYTYVPETTRETFNTKDFKAEHSDLYKQYVRVSNVADSLKTFRLKSNSGDILEG